MEGRLQPQESEGLLSPWLRNRRCVVAARQLTGAKSILDLGSGSGSLARFLSSGTRYLGVDWIGKDRAHAEPSIGPHVVRGNVVAPGLDLLAYLQEQGPFDAIVALAFVEHVEDPAAMFRKYLHLVRPPGMIVVTTPHPSGRTLHDRLARLGLCSRTAAEEHETFLARRELEDMAQALGRKLLRYRRFLFGVNQLAVLG